ncbi:MAG: helix-turn-helix domain-containing protein [Thiobacillus sp.]|nr:helix-turn-helix domain-containing protein [Thiobacillus sp.]
MKLYSIEETAQLLGMARQTLYNKLSQGKLDELPPVVRLGPRVIRFTEQGIQQFIDAHTSQSVQTVRRKRGRPTKTSLIEKMH